ncbi:MAG: S8 family serine peptidase [Candidatus Cloacimonetes bacterium]|nr:S8 family serine peptidase [Candidatus Cloacimonadota bacterium]
MKYFFLILILTLLIYTLIAESTEYFQGELIVQIKGDFRNTTTIEADLQRLEADFSNYGLRVERVLSRRLRIYLISFNDESITTGEFLQTLKQYPLIEEAQFNHKVSLRATPNDPLFNQQWALLNTGQSGGVPGADIDATLAWDITTGGITANGREIVVAVIDDGFSLTHSDINFWKNINEIPGNGIDDDGNGYIDDYEGWNAYNNTGNIPSASHGTHVSGIVGAFGNNNLGVSGVNWNVKIMPIAGSSSNEATVVAAYGYVYEMRSLYNETNGDLGAYVVATNSSFGVNYGQPENYPLWGAMYDAMGEIGILSAAATMNINANVDNVGDVPTAFPSPYLISVTNTTRTDQKSTSAGYGPTTIDLGAPGSQILSTVPGNNYNNMSGTSMASPHVAGAVAMMYAAAPVELIDFYDDYPGELALLLKDMLLESVDVIPALEGITVSGGRLNLNNALQMVLDYNSEDFTPAPFNLTAEYTGNEVLLNWEVYQYRIPHYFLIYRNGEIIAYHECDDNCFTDITISSGWTYDYYVVAGFEDPPGNSNPSNSALVTIPPAAPILIFPENGATSTDTELVFQWQEMYGSESYLLELALDSDFENFFIEPVRIENPYYPISQLPENTTYYWRVLAINMGGNSEWSQTFNFTTGSSSSTDDEYIVYHTLLHKVFPNPFNLNSNSRNQNLQITFSIQNTGFTVLDVFNIKGQLVINIVSEVLSSGHHSFYWDGKDMRGDAVSSGVYLVVMTSSGYKGVIKFLLVK